MTPAATTSREAFLSALRPPPGAGPAAAEPFLAYRTAADVNWSVDLERLHEESSRDHFIDVATRRGLLDGIAGTVGPGAVVADVGCSTGYLLEDLRAAHPDAFLVGVDLVAEGLRKAHDLVPEATLLLADVLDLPFADASVGAVVSANVLEHVADDGAALRELHRVLAPGGRAALVVPAGPGTYDYYDAFLGHERRYARGELAARARGAGFEVVRDAHLGSLIYPAFWLVKKRNRLRHAGAHGAEVEQLVRRDIARTKESRLGAAAARAEERLRARGISLPFGIRSLAVLQKPPTP